MPRTLALLLLALPVTARAADIDFGRDVLPILSQNCFHCHGPDEKARQGGIRLDTKEGAFAKKKNHTLIVPGKPDQSEVIRRVLSKGDDMMPPADSDRKLTQKQIDILRKWVEQGAAWGKHWAFIPPARTIPAPIVKAAHWPRDPLDRFILARLEKEGLSPSAEATREAWLRRVTLDLTGLPPSLREIGDFFADTSPQAHERVVDRLLSSPRYAERMATDWLDLARYADTHGYQYDRSRPMWAYRDWVLRAFDRNQPFDEFITHQLAGDLLPHATKEQRLATAFNRLHMQNEEGGVVEEEFRVAYVVDRVNTMGTAFLGMTFECSRCHDHKYDPLSMRDFYSLFAFFQNIDESGQTTYFTGAMPVPTLLLSTDEQDRSLAELQSRVVKKQQALSAERTKARPAFEAWLKTRGKLPNVPGLVGAYSFDEWKGNSVANSVDAKKPAQAHESPKQVKGKVGQGAHLSGENGFVFPGVGHFTRSDPFTLALWMRAPTLSKRAVVVHHSRAPIDAGSRGYEMLLEDGKVALGLHHMWPGNSLKVRTKSPIAKDAWVHVTATYDGSSRAAGAKLYLDGIAADIEVIRDGLWKDIAYGGGEPNLAIGYRFRDSGFKGGLVDEFRVYDRALTALEVAHIADRDDLKLAWSTPIDKLTDAQRETLFETYFATLHDPAIKLAQELRVARQQHARAIEPIAEAMVMKELDQPKPAFVMKRGAYDAPGDRVSMDTPASLPAFPTDLPRNRLGLAKWLTHPDHPLTARVTVNRLWQQVFGKGLVETSDNFGTTGTSPTHPELLDRLARDFVDDGWDVKHFLRRLVLSSTYRQSSRMTKDLLTKDPYNDLLARAPARRLSAEMLRDQALFTSGLLTERHGGPAMYPYQPDGLWNEAMGRPHYPRTKGSELYRRGVYVFWKRTAPPPAMTTFDAADRSVCTAKRQATSTPLQALALLNEATIVESARFLGQRMLIEGGKAPEAWAFRVVTGRAPTEREANVLATLHQEQLADFKKDITGAKKFLTVGDAVNDDRLGRAELAAAASVALAILNHDGAVYRR